MDQKLLAYELLILKIFNLNRRQNKSLLPIDEGKVAWLEVTLKILTPREEKVLRLRCGLDGNKKMTLQQVADDFGVGREWIRKIEAKALRKIRLHIHKSEARFIRDERDNIIGYVAFFPEDILNLIIQQQQRLEQLSEKNAELLTDVLGLSGKLQSALQIIEVLNEPNGQLEKLMANLKAIEESLGVVESFDEIIAGLKKLKSADGQLKQTSGLIEKLIESRVDQTSLTGPMDLGKFIDDAYAIIPNLSRPISSLEFSNRTNRCLSIAGIQTVGDLIRKSEKDLLRIRNMGRKSLNEIKEILAFHNLRLGMKYPDDFVQTR